MSKRVLITGGNKGIGLAATQLFLEHGFNVVIVARDFNDFPLKKNKQVDLYTFDLSNIEEIPMLLEKIGPVDIIINNSGFSTHHNYITYTEEEVQRILNVNLRAPIEIIKFYASTFLANKTGRIVNVASQAAEIGHTDIWYGITKAGLVNYTKSMASALGKENIVINSISPGPVETRMIQGRTSNERYNKLLERTYLKRFASVEEVAGVIYWLAVDSPTYINGENIDINNGAQRI